MSARMPALRRRGARTTKPRARKTTRMGRSERTYGSVARRACPSPPLTPARDSILMAMLLVLRVLPSTTELQQRTPSQPSVSEHDDKFMLSIGCLVCAAGQGSTVHALPYSSGQKPLGGVKCSKQRGRMS